MAGSNAGALILLVDRYERRSALTGIDPHPVNGMNAVALADMHVNPVLNDMNVASRVGRYGRRPRLLLCGAMQVPRHATVPRHLAVREPKVIRVRASSGALCLVGSTGLTRG